MTTRCWYAALLTLAIAVSGPASAQTSPPPAGPSGLPSIATPNIQVRTLEVRDIKLGSPDTGVVSIDRIAFKSFTRGAETVRADSVEFDNVSAQFGARKLDIPAIAISGFEVPAEVFRALTEGGSLTLDWATILERSTIGEISVHAAIEEYQGSPPIRTTYSGVSLTKLAKGIVASATLARISGYSEPANTDDRVTVSSGEIQYRGIDLAEFVRFVTGGASGEPKPLIERISIADVSVISKEFRASIRKIEQIGLDGRAPPPAPPEPGIVVPGVAPPASPRSSAQYVRDVARHLRISHYGIDGLSIAVPDAELTVEIAALSVGGVSGRAVEHVELRGIEASTPLGKGKLERFVIERINFNALFDMLVEATAAGRPPDFSPEKLGDVTPRSGSLRLTRLELETPIGPISLAESRMDVDDPEPVLPERMTLALTGFKMDIGQALGSEAREQLNALGYGELSADLQVEMRWRPQERALSIENTRLLIESVGRVDLTMRLGNLDPSIGSSNEAAVEKALLGAHIEAIGVRLANLGLAERLYALAMQGSGHTPEAARAALAADLNAQAADLLGPALAPGSTHAIEAFVRSPGRLTAQAALREGQPPLVVGAIADLPLPQLLARIIVRFEVPQK